MSPITTHVLDTALGRPARGVAIELHYLDSAGWREMGRGTTDADGRLRDLVPPGFPLAPGVYRLTFGTGAYHVATGQPSAFFPLVMVVFDLRDPTGHYHVPLLLSPFGYSTYRGS